MSCTKQVRVECSCGGTGKITKDVGGGVISRDSRGWPSYGPSRYIEVSCSCGGKGYNYETVEEHDWGPTQYEMSYAWQTCRKCGKKNGWNNR